jgi:predicted nucleic acid-binding protein
LNPLVILDATPTGLAAKPRGKPDADAFHAWVEGIKAAGYDVAVPGIARYEVRREIFRTGAVGSLGRLDHLHPGLAFLPITDEIMDIASELWAHVRRAGLPTAPDGRLDGDAILAATAIVAAQSFDGVIVATKNVGHLTRFPGIDAREWWTIS